MTINQYRACIKEVFAYTDREAYISDLALSEIWGDAPEDPIPDARLAALGQIWDAAHRTVPEIAKAAGLSNRKLAERFCIPYRTVEDWAADRRDSPLYVRLMLQQCLGLLPSPDALAPAESKITIVLTPDRFLSGSLSGEIILAATSGGVVFSASAVDRDGGRYEVLWSRSTGFDRPSMVLRDDVDVTDQIGRVLSPVVLSGAADNILFLDDAPHLASPGASWYEASAHDIYDRHHTVYWEIVTEDGRTGIDIEHPVMVRRGSEYVTSRICTIYDDQFNAFLPNDRGYDERTDPFRA